MLRPVLVLLIAGSTALACARLIVGHYPDEGPYVSISATHGIHAGAVGIVALWTLLVGALWRWAGRPRPQRIAAR